MRNKILSLLVLLLTAASGAWAADDVLLTTIESKDYTFFTLGSLTFDDKVTVTFSNTVKNYGDNVGWYETSKASLLTVAGTNGYTITSCKFYTEYGTATTGYTVEGESPSVYLSGYKVYTDDSKSVEIGMYGVMKIEVYGAAPAPPVEVTTNAASEGATFTEASFAMPVFDATAEYELVRDMSVQMTAKVGEQGTDGFRIRVKKNAQEKYEPADMTIQTMMALFTVTDGIENKTLGFYGQDAVCDLKIFAVNENGQPTGDAIAFNALEPGRYVAVATAKEGTAYDGETAPSNVFVLYAKTITKQPTAIADLVYNGQEQTLVTAAECEGGEMRYSLDGENWSADVPTALNAGTYTVYYKVIADENDTDPNYQTIENITIAKAELSSVTLERSMFFYDTFGHQPQTVVISAVKAGEVEVPATEYTVEGDTQTDMGDYTVTLTANETSQNFTGQATADWFIMIEPILLDNDEGIVNVTADPETQTLTIDKIFALETVHIPAEINGFQVTAIGPGALSPDASVTDIYLPDTEEPIDIAEGALPEDVTIHTTLALLDDYALMNGLKPNYEGERVMTTVTPANRYWSFSCGVDVLLPEDLTANRVELINNNEVNYNNLTKEQLDMDGERVLKSNNGILMLGEAGKAYDLVAHPGRQASGSAISTDDAKDYGTNLLVPVIVPTHFEPADYYVLKNGQFCAIEDNDSKTPACKAVLKKPAGAALARVLNIVAGSGVTAVFDLNDNGEMINDNWYDLNGRKLDEKPTKKGLYIKNGKKVVMK